jgi:hypothetical protein
MRCAANPASHLQPSTHQQTQTHHHTRKHPQLPLAFVLKPGYWPSYHPAVFGGASPRNNGAAVAANGVVHSTGSAAGAGAAGGGARHPVEGADFPENRLVAVKGGEVVLGKPMEYPSFGFDNEYGSKTIEVRALGCLFWCLLQLCFAALCVPPPVSLESIGVWLHVQHAQYTHNTHAKHTPNTRAPQVPAFKASEFKVTNGEFHAFVRAGGYNERRWWTAEGWGWRTFRNVKWPTFWVPGESVLLVEAGFGFGFCRDVRVGGREAHLLPPAHLHLLTCCLTHTPWHRVSSATRRPRRPPPLQAAADV